MPPTIGLPGQIVVIVLIALAVGLFGWQVYRLYRLMESAKRTQRHGDVETRAARFGRMVLGQSKMFDKPAIGVAHFLIFWGFILLAAGAIERLMGGVLGSFRWPFIGRAHWFVAMNDLAAFIVVLAILYAAFRRLVIRPWHLTTMPDALIILAAIGGHLSALLISEGFAAAAFGTVGEYWSPAGLVLGPPFRALGLAADKALYVGFWWVDIFLILGLLAYIPGSKHFHVVIAPFNVYLKSTKPKGELPKIEDIEEQEHFGASKIEDFTWKDLLDTYACTECGRCTDACPAKLSSKPLDPKKIIVDMRLDTYAHGGMHMYARGWAARDVTPETPLIGGLIHEDELWSCTTCMACIEACPVAIEHVPKIVDMRRYLVLEESRFPSELTATFNNLERHGNPFGFRADTRADWADGLDVRMLGELDEGETVDVLYWVGCYGSFDERNKKVARSLARVLKTAGLTFGILGIEETCTGDPARRMGNEYLYQILAQGNVETLNGYGVKKIVTACPHCMNTLKNEYPQFGGNFEVVHHSQFISGLLKSGQLKLADGVDKKALTFHDPCYLGRYNDVYDAPREVLESLGGAELREMRRSRNKSLCCGGGGGRAFMEEKIGKKMSHNRLEQVLETGAETLAAGCPFCITMFEDGIRTKGVEERVQVEDIAELVAARLPQPAASAKAETAD
ncbi:MAG TPA: (Fe-S)-binding protein [Thermomicrobiales bacterium]|nr:(Fe-S)-binding protein [Thermomicrobiales bacterium]